MGQLSHSVLLGPLLAGSLASCAITPADQEAIRKAWAERDAERAAECRRNGMIYTSAGCIGRGGP